VAVAVAYDSDTELVRKTLLEVAAADARVLQQPPPHVFFRNFGENALEFELAVWIDTPQLEFIITSDLRFAVCLAFQRAGIAIPFPQRELHLKSGFERLRAT